MSQIRHHQVPNLSIITRDQNVMGEKCHMIDITGTEILPVTEMSRNILFRGLTPLKDIFHGRIIQDLTLFMNEIVWDRNNPGTK